MTVRGNDCITQEKVKAEADAKTLVAKEALTASGAKWLGAERAGLQIGPAYVRSKEPGFGWLLLDIIGVYYTPRVPLLLRASVGFGASYSSKSDSNPSVTDVSAGIALAPFSLPNVAALHGATSWFNPAVGMDGHVLGGDSFKHASLMARFENAILFRGIDKSAFTLTFAYSTNALGPDRAALHRFEIAIGYAFIGSESLMER
ncbi:MAG: hypothetical protein NVSMB1_06910 [Polyangiales bacterium]